MKTRRYAPCNLGRQTINLGKQGENNALRIEFDCSAWLAEHENATVKLYYFAPEAEEPRKPVLGAEGTDRVWIVSAEDTATAGNGVIELVLEDATTGTRLKSATGYTTVLHSPSTGREDDPDEHGYVRYDVDQSEILTDEQKAMARKNIGAGSDEGSDGGITQETDPTVPEWAKNPTKPEYTADEVGAISNEVGAVKREHIADLAINNAKLNYESVSNAKIAANTIQTDRLAADTIKYLTGGPYVSVSYDGAARADITQGRHVFALRLIDDSSRNLKTWLLNHSTYDGEYLHQGTDIEGPLKLLGRTDFIGGIHGDEHLVSMRMIADGVDITGAATDLSGVKTLAVYVTSTVNDEDGGAVLFSREKVLTFNGMSLTVENRWTYTGAESVSVERWPGCGLYSTFVANTLGYTTNTVLTPTMDALEADAAVREASFWVSGTRVTLQALRGMDEKNYAGFVENVSGASRIKAYFDAIHAPEGYALKTGDVLEAAYKITIGGEAAGKIHEIPTIPDALPNPKPLTINGQSYDGSEAVDVTVEGGGSNYTLPVASPDALGGVKPTAKTDEMTQAVGVDAEGKLWGMPGGSGGEEIVYLMDVTLEEEASSVTASISYEMQEKIRTKLISVHAIHEINPTANETYTENGNVKCELTNNNNFSIQIGYSNKGCPAFGGSALWGQAVLSPFQPYDVAMQNSRWSRPVRAINATWYQTGTAGHEVTQSLGHSTFRAGIRTPYVMFNTSTAFGVGSRFAVAVILRK